MPRTGGEKEPKAVDPKVHSDAPDVFWDKASKAWRVQLFDRTQKRKRCGGCFTKKAKAEAP